MHIVIFVLGSSQTTLGPPSFHQWRMKPSDRLIQTDTQFANLYYYSTLVLQTFLYPACRDSSS